MNSKNDVVGGNSKRTFTLHWIAETGEHSYTVKLYSLLGGQKSEEDERGISGALSEVMGIVWDAIKDKLFGG